MNNGAKSANIMTWATFKKKFNPTLYSTTDSLWADAKQIVEPTLRQMGFYEDIIFDADEETKPLQQVKSKVDVMRWNYIIYHKWRHRDGSGIGISIFYK